jgi:hypothetical protein
VKPSQIAQEFVGRVLNNFSVEGVNELFSRSYVDHDPIVLPGLISPRSGKGSLRDIVELGQLLSLPEVDVHFTLEDALYGEQSASFRIFGEGTIKTSPEPVTARYLAAKAIRTGSDPATYVRAHSQDMKPSPGKFLLGSTHISIRCVGMFSLKAGLIQERWGPYQIR